MVSELGVASDILPLLERHGSARGETPHIAYAGNAEAMSALCAVIGETSGEKVTGACADMAIASRLPFENWFLSVSPGDGLFRLGGGQAGLAGPYRFEHLAIQRSNSAIEFKEARAVRSFGHRESVSGRLGIFFLFRVGGNTQAENRFVLSDNRLSHSGIRRCSPARIRPGRTGSRCERPAAPRG